MGTDQESSVQFGVFKLGSPESVGELNPRAKPLLELNCFRGLSSDALVSLPDGIGGSTK